MSSRAPEAGKRWRGEQRGWQLSKAVKWRGSVTVEHKQRRQPSKAWTWSGCVVIGFQLWADLATVCISGAAWPAQ